MGMGEIVLIFVVYLLLFGSKGIPSLAQSMGKAMYQFRNAARDVQNEIMTSANEIKKEVNMSNAPATKRTPFDRPKDVPPSNSDPETPKPDQDFSSQ